MMEWFLKMSLSHTIVHELREMRRELSQSRERDVRAEELLMAVVAEVQALLDAVAAQGVAITDATNKIGELEAHGAELEAKVAAIQPNVPIDAEDLAAIVGVTSNINASIVTIKSALPQPVAPAIVDAVVEAPPAPPSP